MKLLLNGQEVEFVQPEQATLGAALTAVQDNHISEDQVISTIFIDGEPLTAERLAEWRDRPVDDFDEAHIESLKRNILAARGLRMVAAGLAQSGTQREQIVNHLGQGRSTEALKMLNEYLQVWNTTQQSLASVARLLDINFDSMEVSVPADDSVNPQARPLLESFNHLTAQLQQLKSALQAQDLVLLGDILEYEFGPLTENWQDMLAQLADSFENQD